MGVPFADEIGMRRLPHKRRGFSLTELVVVVVILGVIATIAIPRLGNASGSATAAKLLADTRTLQVAIDRYDAEHQIPLGLRANGSRAAGLTAYNRLLQTTDEMGNLVADGPLGPYLASWPENAINGKVALTVDSTAVGSATNGWRLDPDTSTITPSVAGGSVVQLGNVADSGLVVDTPDGSVRLDGSLNSIGGADGRGG